MSNLKISHSKDNISDRNLEKRKIAAVLEGIFSILESLKEVHPTLSYTIDKAIKTCSSLVVSENITAIYSQLVILSDHVKSGITEDKNNIESAISSLADKISSFDQRIFNKNQTRSILSLQAKINSGELSIYESIEEISSISQDISVAVSSAIQATYGGKSLLPSMYSEGVEKIMHADIAIATNRLSVDLDRLSSILCRENPNNEDIQSIRGEVVGLKIHEGKTKFFESMDILSRLSWSIHKINDKKIENDKEYLGNLASYFESMADKIKSSSDINNRSINAFSRFEDEFKGHMKNLESSIKNKNSIEDLKETMMVQIKTMRSSMRKLAGIQHNIIENQERVIESQYSQLLNMEANLASISEDLNLASKDILKDALSGIANRRGYDFHNDKLYKKWQKKENNGPLSIIIIDIDDFNSIIKKNGDNVRDLIINWIGGILKNIGNSHKNIFFARYNENKFVISMEAVSPYEALSLAKRIHNYIQKTPFVSNYHGVSINMTVSIGLAFFIDREDSPNSVFSYADKALNQSRTRGKNQIWVSRASVIAERIGPLKQS